MAEHFAGRRILEPDSDTIVVEVPAVAEQAAVHRHGELPTLLAFPGRHIELVAGAHGEVHVHVQGQGIGGPRIQILRTVGQLDLDPDPVQILAGVVLPGHVHPHPQAGRHRNADGRRDHHVVGLASGAEDPLDGRVEQLAAVEVDTDQVVDHPPVHRPAVGVFDLDPVAPQPAVDRPGEPDQRGLVALHHLHVGVLHSGGHRGDVERTGRDGHLVPRGVDGDLGLGIINRDSGGAEHQGGKQHLTVTESLLWVALTSAGQAI